MTGARAADRWWGLWGLGAPEREAIATGFTLLLMVISRFAVLPSGPWEWDETLFARGIMDFELAAHFPHPPGFPLWLALGWVLWPLAGEPLVALQWASSAASVALVWPLALIGRRVAPAPVAAMAALLVSVLPGPWLFAVRGFSSTAATALVLAAAAVWSRGGLGGHRATAFTLLLTAGFLVRPILLPVIGLMWLAGIATVRPWKRTLPGVGAGTAAVGLAVAIMAWLEGGWAAFVFPFVRHFGRHTGRLHLNTGGFADLGLVTGVGGEPWALLLVVLATTGLAVWVRRVGRRSATVWVAVLVTLVVQLLTLQNRTYARYAVAAQLTSAPLIAAAVSLAPTPAALCVLAIATAGAAATSWPLLLEQHDRELPAWTAAHRAEALARERGWAVVVEPEVYVFASYRWHLLERRGIQTPPLVLSPRAPESWQGVDRPWVVATVHRHLYLDSLGGGELSWGGVSPRLRRLTQNRFLEASVIANPPLPVGPWWSRESTPEGEAFMWAGADAELWLPPMPVGSRARMPVRIQSGEAPLNVRSDGVSAARLPGTPGRTEILDLFRRQDEGPWVFGLGRSVGYPPGGGDQRPLAVAVGQPWFRPPDTGFRIDLESSEARVRDGLAFEGAYPLEHFGSLGAGHWFGPHAVVVVDVPGPGVVELELAAPRPTAPATMVSAGLGRTVGPVDFSSGPRHVGLTFTEACDGVRIEVLSRPYSPAEEGVSEDRRSLGVVITGVSWRPSRPPSDDWWRHTLDELESNAAR